MRSGTDHTQLPPSWNVKKYKGKDITGCIIFKGEEGTGGVSGSLHRVNIEREVDRGLFR